MLHLLITGWVCTIAAGGEPSVDGADASTEAMVQESVRVRRSFLNDFAGTVSFDYLMTRRESENGLQDVPQQWSITVDDQGSLRARIVWPAGQGATPWHFGRADGRMWLLWNEELVIYKDDVALEDSSSGESVALGLIKRLLRQAENQVAGLLGPPAPEGALEILTLDPSAANPVVAVEGVDGVSRTMSFERFDDLLLLRDSAYIDGGRYTIRWKYTGRQHIGDHWLPTAAHFETFDKQAGNRSLRIDYTSIRIEPAIDRYSPEFARALQVPRLGESGIGRVAVVTTHSKHGVTYTSFEDGSTIPSTQ